MGTLSVLRHWIPPFGLLVGTAAHGMSWLMLFALAPEAGDGITLGKLAWAHLVALGWLTMIALSVLIHAIPAFTDNAWHRERVARGALVAYAIGVGGLVAAFWFGDVAVLPAWAGVVFTAVAGYLVCAFATLFVPPPRERRERAIARALGVALGFLGVTVVFGTGLTVALNGIPAWLALAPVHASLGLFGWLSLLVVGVSTRTVRVIAGGARPPTVLHAAIGGIAVVGIVLLAAGLGTGTAAPVVAAVAALALAVALYGVQLAGMLGGGRNPHVAPKAFVVAAYGWLIVASVLGAAGLATPRLVQPFAFVLLAGWLGSMVNGHLYHLGVRLIATVIRGDDDETAPRELLDPRLSWASFVLFQIALASGLAGLVAGAPEPARLAGACGMAGWLLTLANLAAARGRAKTLPRRIVLA